MNEKAEETSVSATPPTKPQDIVLEEVDRLRLENAQLRIMSMERNRELLMKDVEQLDVRIERQQASYMAILSSMAQKYGFDPNITVMEPSSGRIVPRPNAQHLARAVQAATASPSNGSTR
jgi:hypothetical protein